MKLAESVRVRWVLAATSIAFVGSAAAMMIASHHHHASPRVAVVQRHEVPFIGGCHQRHKHVAVTAHAPTPPPPETTGDTYGDALLAIRPALDACMKKSSREVTYRLSVDVGSDGVVRTVDVRSEAQDMRKVSLKTTQCLERAAQTAKFPTSAAPTRVSTVLRP
ncbi:MAG TPA: hypothetical protein VGM39_24165 [Kofleriaceae bacterium]|jgi:hypothetical protein